MNKLRSFTFVFLACVGACGDDDDFVECSGDSDCLQGGILGVCLDSPRSDTMWCAFPDTTCPISEQRWGLLSGDGLAELCVEIPDGGLDGAADAGVDALVDASDVDAVVPPDGEPGGPIAVSGQYATLVLGQPNFTSGLTNCCGGISANSLYTPVGLAAAGTRLWVADNGNARVLQWDSLPVVNQQASNVTIGQGSPTTSSPGASQTTMGQLLGGSRVTTDGTRVVASDSINNRVLVWNPIPAGHGAAASIVLGQSSFTSTTAGKGANTLDRPFGLWTDGTMLVVADSSNNRVLIWHTFPTGNGAAADTVLGQTAFGLGAGDPVESPPTASSMNSPQDVFFDGTRLYVVDRQNHRVMVWNSMPAVGEHNKAADFFLGQSGATNGSANAGGASPNAVGFNNPRGVTVALGAVFVSDFSNHRVLVFQPIPTASGEAAIAALGQDDLTMAVDPADPEQNRIKSPYGLVVTDGRLYVSDFTWNRVTRYDLNP